MFNPDPNHLQAAQDLKNPFLSRVGVLLRRDRERYQPGQDVTVGQEMVDGQSFVRVWFRTRGCSCDRQGLCTMCNYGASDTIPDGIVDRVREVLSGDTVPSGATVLLSPSGSMFDTREVPTAVRQALFALVAETRAASIICETRPETVTFAAMQEYQSLVGDKQAVVEMGLESADPWILRWCVNKRLSVDQFFEAAGVCHDAGVTVAANVSLGTAFLDPAAAIDDAVKAAQKAIDSGIDACVLFPLHVRRWTVLEWLWRHGLYTPPSLWSLVEAILRINQGRQGQVSTAWYRDYNEGNPAAVAAMPVLASPASCPRCQLRLLAALDTYRDQGDTDALEAAAAVPCTCHDSIPTKSVGADPEFVAKCYVQMGQDVLGVPWWDSHGASVLSELREDWARRQTGA